MVQVQPTTTISIDDTVFEVTSMSPEIQQMVQYLDDWRQKEADTTSELLMARGALRDLQNTLLQAIKAATAPAEGVVEEAPETEAPAAE
jgi:hypothetical protein